LEDSKQPLTEHLTELRKRLLISVGCIFLGFVVLFNFSEKLFDILMFPLKHEMRLDFTSPYFHINQKTPISLVFLAPAEAFWMHMKVSFVAAFIASLPVIFFQIWKFISPGLLSKEKKYVTPFLFSATLLFLTGALFCFVIILPFAMTFLLGYKTGNLSPMISVGSYIDFCLKFILAFGAIFELPVAIIFLTKFGIVSPESLAKKRKFAVLFAFIAAAILTPTPDAFNQVLMAVPIIVLYEIGIILSKIIFRKKKFV
jgi:sec-independent protein translocase protein TatC